MKKNNLTVVNLDPIDQKKKIGFIGKLLITTYYGGNSIKKMPPYGHYLFAGSQGSGKTAGFLWYAEKLAKKHKKKYKQKIEFYSNIGIGKSVNKRILFDTIVNFPICEDVCRIVLIDEIHTYFPKNTTNKETKLIIEQLINVFSQLRKRNTYILSTSQVYGRLSKELREQCLYMVNCRVSLNGRLVNEFIRGDDIICDELGRWAGRPRRIYVHGLSKLEFDTRRVITD